MDSELKAILESLTKKVNTLQETVDRSIEQQDGDMKRITDLEVQMGKLLSVSEGAREDIAGNYTKVIKEVEEHLAPMPDIVAEAVREAVKKKKGLFK